MNFLIDAQLPPAVAHWLKDRGHTAAHLQDLNLAGAEDSVVWEQAVLSNAILLTKDEDFAQAATRKSGGPVIVWLRVGNATNKSLFEWLEPRWEAVVELLEAGNRLIEVR